MYGSIDDTVLDLAMEPDQDASALYISIEALFQANKESRAVVLGQEFHNMSQVALSVDAYAQQMKHTADALREVGHPVTATQLVLNLLRGINDRFANTVDIIARRRFPTSSPPRTRFASRSSASPPRARRPRRRPLPPPPPPPARRHPAIPPLLRLPTVEAVAKARGARAAKVDARRWRQ